MNLTSGIGKFVKYSLFVGTAWAAATTAADAAPIVWDATFYNDAGLSNADYSIFKSNVQNAFSYYSNTFSSPNAITVKVDIHAGSTGLGSTAAYRGAISYLDYRNALANTGTSAADATALSFLPGTAANPTNGSTDFVSSLPLLRALGFAAGNLNVPWDASVVLNVGLMNLDRGGPVDPNKYDLTQVTLHELNEVLGWTSALNAVPNDPVVSPTGAIEPADLYRYAAPGVRSFTSDLNQPAYFSIDGGVTKLANFNTDAGGDRHDFNGLPFPSVQDAYSTPNIALNNGLAEKTFLDVIGFNVVNGAVPEPGTWAMMLAGFGVIGASMRYRRRSTKLSYA